MYDPTPLTCEILHGYPEWNSSHSHFPYAGLNTTNDDPIGVGSSVVLMKDAFPGNWVM